MQGLTALGFCGIVYSRLDGSFDTYRYGYLDIDRFLFIEKKAVSRAGVPVVDPDRVRSACFFSYYSVSTTSMEVCNREVPASARLFLRHTFLDTE